MYAKLFSRITESSLMEEDVATRFVFMALLAIADPQGYVIGTDVALARRMNMPFQDFNAAIKRLMAPDPESNSKEEDGRRIVRSDCERGYYLVNYLKYRNTRDEGARRDYQRAYREKYRAEGRDKARPVNNGQHGQPQSTQAEAEAEAEAEEKGESAIAPPSPSFPSGEPKQQPRSSKKGSKAFVKPTIEEVREFCESEGLEERDADAFFHGKDGNGWKNGSSPIKDWKATVRSWEAQGYHPSQKDLKDKPVRNCI